MELDKSLLYAELNAQMDETLYEQMLLKANQEIQNSMSNPQKSKPIQPQPGFCIKTSTSKNEKVFINICTSHHIPAHPDLSEQELVSILESDDPSGYRIPMSIGEPHVEVDHSGNGCAVYDIVINRSFFSKIENNEFFREFFLTVAMEGLENKYGLELSREWRMLKNRKFMGSLFEQNIRTASKPIIQEMDPNLSEVPEYTIIAEPSLGHPSFLVAEISLPRVSCAKSLILDLGEDRIVLFGHPDLYHMDIFIPYNILQEESGAQFNKDKRVLTITMPVQPA